MGSQHYDIQKNWAELLDNLSESFGEVDDLKQVIFLVGVQELGQGYRTFSKDEKMDLMHIAVCRLLSDRGYYKYIGKDDDGWPHYEIDQPMPELSESEKEIMMKEAVLRYFDVAP
jgi:hypothetical protein